jgi:uncharacterized protein
VRQHENLSALAVSRKSPHGSVGRPVGSAARRKVQFVVKTSKFCNLRCRYCYEFPELGDRKAMSPGQVQSMYRSIADHFYRRDEPVAVEFDWHGGEPLLLDPDFYWRTFDEQTRLFEDSKITITNCVQTNLAVLNDRQLKLLREGFDGVGVSVDLFCGARVNTGGRNTLPAVLKNMDRLRDAGVSFGCITVVGRENITHLRKIFRFFEGASLPVRVLLVRRGADDSQNEADLLSEDEALRTLIELFEMWIESPAPIVLDPIDSYTRNVIWALAGGLNVYYDKANWEPIYIVNTDGNLFSYSDMYDASLSHGNLFEESMRSIVNGVRHQRATHAAKSRMVAACSNCRHYGRACTGYPIAEESLDRRDAQRGGEAPACIRERGIYDYIERRLLELGIVDASGKLVRSSKCASRFDPSPGIPA